MRSISVGQRTRVHAGACPHEVAETLGQLAERLFDAVLATLPEMEQRVGGVTLPPVNRYAPRAG